MGKGAPFKNWLSEITSFIETNKNSEGFKKEFRVLAEAFHDYQSILVLLQSDLKDGKATLLPLYSTRIMNATSMIYCGMLILEQALLASRKLKELGEAHFDTAYYQGKIASARFYIMNEVPQIFTIKRAFELADTSAIDMPEEALG
jgi:hypothetical protein